MDKKKTEDENMNRRKLLRGAAGATSALFVGTNVTGSVAATDGLEAEIATLLDQYDSREALETAIKSHAGDLLQEISRQGYLNRPDVSMLPLGTRLSPAEFDENKAGVKMTAVVQDGKPTARIVVNYPIGETILQLYVLPELRQSYVVSKGAGAGATDSRTTFTANTEGVQTTEITPNVESYKTCQREYFEPSKYRCNDVWTQCWGETTSEGCLIKEATHGDCGTDCPSDLCQKHCGYY